MTSNYIKDILSMRYTTPTKSPTHILFSKLNLSYSLILLAFLSIICGGVCHFLPPLFPPFNPTKYS